MQAGQFKPPKRFNTQPPEGGWFASIKIGIPITQVSTHSRLKAAGRQADSKTSKDGGFNTQPPEGGWLKKDFLNVSEYWFQHTAA